MDYLNKEFLTEDLIDNLGLRQAPSVIGKFLNSFGGLAKALVDFKSLSELTDEGEYEQFLYNGFSDIYKKYSFLVTYQKKLYTVTGVKNTHLGIQGFSSELKSKKIALKFLDIMVKKSGGNTNYDSKGNYTKLRGKEGESVMLIYGDTKTECEVDQISQNRVILRRQDDATVSLDNTTYYTSTQDDKISIVYANILFDIVDFDKEKNDNKFVIDKNLFDLDERDINPKPRFMRMSNETALEIKSSISKKSFFVISFFSDTTFKSFNKKLESQDSDSALISIYEDPNQINLVFQANAVDSRSISFSALDNLKKNIKLDFTNLLGFLPEVKDPDLQKFLENFVDDTQTSNPGSNQKQEIDNKFPVLFISPSSSSSLLGSLSDKYKEFIYSNLDKEASGDSLEQDFKEFIKGIDDKSLLERLKELYTSGIQNKNVKYIIKISNQEPDKGEYTIASFNKDSGIMSFKSTDTTKDVNLKKLSNIKTQQSKIILTFPNEENSDNSDSGKGSETKDENKDNTSEKNNASGEDKTKTKQNSQGTSNINESYLINFFS